MQIIFKRSFLKQYHKLQKNDQTKIDKAILLFEKNPLDPKLKNHTLVGKLSGKRSISAGFDLRIIFQTEENYVMVTMLALGSHNQVY